MDAQNASERCPRRFSPVFNTKGYAKTASKPACEIRLAESAEKPVFFRFFCSRNSGFRRREQSSRRSSSTRYGARRRDSNRAVISSALACDLPGSHRNNPQFRPAFVWRSASSARPDFKADGSPDDQFLPITRQYLKYNPARCTMSTVTQGTHLHRAFVIFDGANQKKRRINRLQ